MSTRPKIQFLDDYQDSLVSRGERLYRHPPSLPPHTAGSGAGALRLRDPSEFNLPGADRNPREMNGQPVGQMQQVTTRSQRKGADASRGKRRLWAGVRSRFFSDPARQALKLIPTSWAS